MEIMTIKQEMNEDIFSDEPNGMGDDETYPDPFAEVPEFPVNKVNGEEIECELWQLDGFSELRTNGLLRGDDGVYKTEIKSLDDIDYILQRISHYEGRTNQTVETYDNKIKKLEAQIKSLRDNKSDAMKVWSRRAGFFRSLFTVSISEFVAGFIGQSKVRSMKLPTGRVGWKVTEHEKWNITDESIVLPILKEFNPDSVRESILVSKLPKPSEGIKSLLTMVEGDMIAYDKLSKAIEITEKVDSFYLEADKQDGDT